MRTEYDFSKARKTPYALKLKKLVTIRLDQDAFQYFKTVSEEVGIPTKALSIFICVTVQQRSGSLI